MATKKSRKYTKKSATTLAVAPAPKKKASEITKELQAEVVAQVVESLGQGILPWAGPLTGFIRPVNAVRDNSYRGINFLLLNHAQKLRGYEHGRWMTFVDIVKAGGRLRKGEPPVKGLKPMKGKPIPVKKGAVVSTEKAEAESAAESASDTKTFTPSGFSPFYLFNVAQCDNLDVKYIQGGPRPTQDDALQAAKDLIAATGATVMRTAITGHYSPGSDTLVSAPFEAFDSEADAVVELLHLLIHWTGHESRLDRDLTTRLGIHAEAGEELVAHLATSFLQADLGLNGTLRHTNFASKWVDLLHNHPRVLFTCTKAAEAAVTHLLTYIGKDVDHEASKSGEYRPHSAGEIARAA